MTRAQPTLPLRRSDLNHPIPSPNKTTQSGPKASLYLTLVGILAGFLSTFWAFGYQRISQRMQEYLDGVEVAKIKKQQVGRSVGEGLIVCGGWGWGGQDQEAAGGGGVVDCVRGGGGARSKSSRWGECGV